MKKEVVLKEGVGFSKERQFLQQMMFLFGTTALLFIFSVRDPNHKKMFASESHGESLFVSLRLKEHGALVIGKTNLDCRNPRNVLPSAIDVQPWSFGIL